MEKLNYRIEQNNQKKIAHKKTVLMVTVFLLRTYGNIF